MLLYNPLRWYWIVGGNGPHIIPPDTEHTGDDTQRYSSAANAYVPLDDPDFVAWRDHAVAMVGYDPSTRIDSDANLATVLEPYGIIPPAKPPALPQEPTAAELTGGTFTDAELDGLLGDLAANGAAWLGFDLAVDGTQRPVRQQFGGVQNAYDVCTLINAQLGPYAVTTMPGDAAPWRFMITSNTTGSGSTIGYALPPSTLNRDELPEPLKGTTDISAVLRLTQAVGAVATQGKDGTE